MTSGDKWMAGDAYEAYMGRWSRSLARVFVGWLRPEPSAHWLEVGCGTGALTSAICGLCEPASVVAIQASVIPPVFPTVAVRPLGGVGADASMLICAVAVPS